MPKTQEGRVRLCFRIFKTFCKFSFDRF